MLTADEINGAKDCNELEPSERQDEHLRPSVVAVDLAPWVVVNDSGHGDALMRLVDSGIRRVDDFSETFHSSAIVEKLFPRLIFTYAFLLSKIKF